MKKCNKGCYPICDYCKFYEFNPDRDGGYIGLGYCTKYKMGKDPCSVCNGFECIFVENITEKIKAVKEALKELRGNKKEMKKLNKWMKEIMK